MPKTSATVRLGCDDDQNGNNSSIGGSDNNSSSQPQHHLWQLGKPQFTLRSSNILIPLTTSTKLNFCGVVTMTEPDNDRV